MGVSAHDNVRVPRWRFISLRNLHELRVTSHVGALYLCICNRTSRVDGGGSVLLSVRKLCVLHSYRVVDVVVPGGGGAVSNKNHDE